MSDWHPCIVRLGKVEPLPNSDFLEITTVMNEYPVIIKKGTYKQGDLVAFLPYDSVVPDLQIFHFLAPPPKKHKDGTVTPSPPVGSVPEKYRTIKSRLVRGTYSEGIIIDAPAGYEEGDSIVEHFGLTKRVYEEELPDLPTKGSNENISPPKSFQLSKYDLQGLAKYGYAFEEGEEVLIQEKIEGQNISFTYAEGKLWVKSRNYFKRNGYFKKPRTLIQKLRNFFTSNWNKFKSIFVKEKPKALSSWWEIPIRYNLEEKLSKYPLLTIYGESYGNVRGWAYDCEIVNNQIQTEFRCFDIYDHNTKKFLEWNDVISICYDLGLKFAPTLYEGPWKTDRSLHELAEGKSSFGDCIREGIVIRSVPEAKHPKLGRKIVKLKGRDYKLAKG